MYYYVTTYSFDNDRPVQGPFGDFDACWDAMLKDAKNEYRIDVEEDGFTAELREDHDTGVINLVRLVDDTDDDTTTWSAIELPAHGPAKVYNVVQLWTAKTEQSAQFSMAYLGVFAMRRM